MTVFDASIRLLISAAALALVGCAPAGACEAGVPEVELGRGLDDYEALEPGEHLELERGSQGGYHTTMGILAAGLGESLRVELEGEHDDKRIAHDVFRLEPACEDGAVIVEDLRLIWNTTPELLHEADVVVRATVVGDDGEEAEAELGLVIVDPEAG